MKLVPIFALALMATFTTIAQKPTMRFDHFALYVQDIDSSVSFFSGLLELDSIPTPFKGQPVKWYDLGGGMQLHVIGGSKTRVAPPLFQHPCFTTSDLDRFVSRLKTRGIPYFDAMGKPGTQVRGDGVTQLFIQDPDGNWIEINTRFLKK